MSEIDLVTGGAGYFGTLLAEALLRTGRRVRILDIHEAELQGAEKMRGDIRDRALVEKACTGVSIVHHNVALVPLAKDKSAFFEVNEGGTRNLLDAALRTGVKKVVSMSSSAVYGVPDANPVNEDSRRMPGEAYGRAKLAGEDLCREYVERGLDVTIIRPRTIMGHGRLGIMQILFEWIRRGRNIPVLGRGDNRYQFVHADDLVSACMKAAERPGAASYNIGAEQFGTMRELLEALCAYARTGSRVVSVPASAAVKLMKLTSELRLSPLGAYHAMMYGQSMYFDVSRAKTELAWSASRSNIEMFIDSYDWYCRNRTEVFARKDASHHRSPVKQGVLALVSLGLQLADRMDNRSI